MYQWGELGIVVDHFNRVIESFSLWQNKLHMDYMYRLKMKANHKPIKAMGENVGEYNK